MNLRQEDKDLQLRLEAGWQLFVASRWDEALRVFHSVLIIDPDIAMASSVAGACLLRLGHFEEAEEYARAGVRVAPGIALAHSFLAEALCANEKYPEAESEYWEAVALNPALGPYLDLGRFLISQDRHNDARPTIERAIELFPEDPDAHYLMAICHSRDQANEKAMSEIDLAIKFAPGSSRAWHFRGLVLVSRAKGTKKQREKAEVFRSVSESLRKAVELDPSNAEARMQLNLVYHAIAEIEQYLDSIGDLKRGWWQIALCGAGLIIFAIIDRSFWINAIIIVAALSALALWRNRRRLTGQAPDPLESIHPLELPTASAGFRETNNAKLVNEWLN